MERVHSRNRNGAGSKPESVDPFRLTRSVLAEAIAARQICPHFQPKVHCRTRAVHSFEALARWRHPEGGMVPAADFIGLAEREGLIGTLTEMIFEESLEWISRLQEQGRPMLCVNMSAAMLEDGQIVDTIVSQCVNAGVSPESVILELTETRTLENPVAALEFVTQLRIKGFHAAIDDVGTGYASHRRLALLPFSFMKMDQSLVQNMNESSRSRSIVENLIHLGHSLGLVVVGEGIEERSVLDALDELGCDLAQGYWIARPMSGRDAENWLAEKRADH